jgi:hypothetical protein
VICAWCHGPIPNDARRDSKFCGKTCRQASWRFHRGRHHRVVGRFPELLDATDRPLRFAYADPPYPGKASYYPEKTEVDHASLVDRLVAEFPDGWALSTASGSLRDVLPLCPPDVRVCAWFKGPRPGKSRRALISWEPLLVWRGRPLSTAVVQDLSDGLIAQGRYHAFPGAMIGMKPPPFSEWMFRQLGARPGDDLVDLFPGSGAIGEAWARYATHLELFDATFFEPSPEARVDASFPAAARRDASGGYRSDASLMATADASLPPG